MARTPGDRTAILQQLGEVFREHGFEGASLALITAATGLGKGSLYHFFPGGKDDMAAAVLAHVDDWFESNVFRPLREEADPRAALAAMLDAVETYFRSGRRLCLVGVIALGNARSHFGTQVRGYFAAWERALVAALVRLGSTQGEAGPLAEEILAIIQGALVLARAADDPGVFTRAIDRLYARLEISRPPRKGLA